MSKVMEIKLEDTVEIFCARFSHTDTLCHEDDLDTLIH